MAEFMFVNLNEPTQNKRREVRKLVRSHVSYIQHSQKRGDLGQVEKQSKSRYIHRSVNGWAVLDDSGRAGQTSKLNASAAFGVHSCLLPQRQPMSTGLNPIRHSRQLCQKELPADGKSRRRLRRDQFQPRALPMPPTPIVNDDVTANINEDPPQAVSTMPTVKSETEITSPGWVFIKQEPDYETDHKWDIVSHDYPQSQEMITSSVSGGREGEWQASRLLPSLHSSLGDPTDELRNRIEVSGLSFSSVLAFLASVADLMGPDCDNAYSLPKGSLQKHLMDGIATDQAARASILACSVGAISSYRQVSLHCAHIFGLRGYAINCVQAAMSSPDTRHSDNTALAVASLGNFEVIMGCDRASQTHRQGVSCIKNARGGSLPWILDGVLSWMATLGRPQITRGTFAILDRPNAAK